MVSGVDDDLSDRQGRSFLRDCGEKIVACPMGKRSLATKTVRIVSGGKTRKVVLKKFSPPTASLRDPTLAPTKRNHRKPLADLG